MYKFSQHSQENLNSAHPLLQQLFTEVIKITDCSITCGHRDKLEQEKAFNEHHSMAHWLQSPHNFIPALAVDCVPYPSLWSSEPALIELGIVILNKAQELGIKIRWGGNFKSFKDYPHYELADWKERLKTDILYFKGDK